MVKAIPEGYHTITPYLVVENPGRLIDFLTRAFGARETERIAQPDGSIMHAEVRIGDSAVMMGGAGSQHPAKLAGLYLYVEDVDAAYAKALQAGATSITAPADQFYGDRSAGVTDPAGNTWWIATHIEDVPREQLASRAEAAMKQHRGGA